MLEVKEKIRVDFHSMREDFQFKRLADLKMISLIGKTISKGLYDIGEFTLTQTRHPPYYSRTGG